MKEKLVALKDKFLDFVDAVKADPKKQFFLTFLAGVVVGFAVRSLA